jgi:hypothetical protein
MKPLYIFLIFLLSFSKVYSQISVEKAVITKNSDNVDPNFDNTRRFESTLDTKNIEYLNPEQAYSKILFLSVKKRSFIRRIIPLKKLSSSIIQ